MKAQSTINIENLIPSTLLEEEHSDNESISNKKLKDNIPLFKDIPQENISDNVNHIFINFILFYRTKMIIT